jgi:hypothetical protein
MYPRFVITSFVVTLSLAVAAHGQSTAQAPTAPVPSAILQPALSDVQSSTSALNISRWKAPGEVRTATQQDVDSIQRDLGNMLPGLIAQADASPGSVPPSFTVYRNLDALYDVLLRVSETANLAAPSSEAASVASSLQKLEAARSQLGEAILHTSQHQETQIAAFQAAIRAAKAVPAAQKTETVIDDGPVRTPARRAKRKTVPKKPAPKPAAGTPAATPSH